MNAKRVSELFGFIGRSNKGEGHDLNRPMTVGLSANQVGIMKKISIVDLAVGKKDFNDLHVLINPKIIWHSKTKFKHFEGCVNLPEIWGEISRFSEVHVEALDRSGNIIILKLKDWPAVVLQHEIDHLNGKLFIDHLSNPKKAHFVKRDETAKWRKNRKEWSEFIDVQNLLSSD
jgi:peptide deformylase